MKNIYVTNSPLQFIEHYPNDNVFKNVVIKGGVSYFLINKEYSGDTLFNNLKINMKKYDIILEPKFYKLIDEIIKKCNNSLSDIYCSQGIFLTAFKVLILSSSSLINVSICKE